MTVTNRMEGLLTGFCFPFMYIPVCIFKSMIRITCTYKLNYNVFKCKEKAFRIPNLEQKVDTANNRAEH